MTSPPRSAGLWTTSKYMDFDHVTIHQCLHGYAEGHRLLKSSIQLPRAAQRALLVLSDLSGVSVPAGFATYLTGYPVPETEFYALARSWLAPEMGRPGCVWTHTLLLTKNDLGRIQSDEIGEYFHRPDDSVYSYEVAIKCTALTASKSARSPTSNRKSSESIAAELARGLVHDLYSRDDAPVFMPASRADEYEELVLWLWAQQWPQLRTRFRFCTGSLANRTLEGAGFDLQVIPANLVRQIQRDVPKACILKQSQAALEDFRQPWVEVLLRDLKERNHGDFGKFESRFCRDWSPARSSLRTLAAVYAALASVRGADCVRVPEYLSSLVEELYRGRRGAGEGRALREALFYPSGESEPLLGRVTNDQWLRALLMAKPAMASEDLAAQVRERTHGLWRMSPQLALECAEAFPATEETVLRREFLETLSKLVTARDLCQFESKTPGLLSRFVAFNPDLALSPELLGATEPTQLGVLDGLIGPEPVADSQRMVAARFVAQTPYTSVARAAVARWGEQILVAALQTLIDSSVTPPGSGAGLAAIITDHVDALCEWLALVGERYSALQLTARMLNPRSAEIQNVEISRWQEIGSAVSPSGHIRRQPVEFATFLFTLGLNSNQPDAHKVVAMCFEGVHDAAARGELDQRSWELLKPDLVELPHYQQWDICERLRRALVLGFVRHDWPLVSFFACTAREDLFDRMLDSCSFIPAGREFSTGLEKVAFGKSPGVTPAHRRTFDRRNNKWFRWF